VSNSVLIEIEIRRCHGADEMQQCVELQRHAWGFSDLELVPRRMFVVAEKIGGHVLGAWHGKHLAGFAMALPALRHDGAFLHSHMLAVDAPYRRQGLAHRLKMAQREDGLRRGIRRMEWTFDPLQTGNAYFNLQKVGAVARRYLPAHYGVSSSRLQAGLPTDRLVAEWHLVHTEQSAPATIVERIEVSPQIAAWKETPAELAKAIAEQSRIRAALENAFARGLVACGFERGQDGGGTYLLCNSKSANSETVQEGIV
jgi:predicted GNAT superfamily acetyltransferase